MLSLSIRKSNLLMLVANLALWTIAAAGQPQAAPAAAAATRICGGRPLCAETSDFVASVTSFRTSAQGVYKVVAVSLRLQNKTAQPLILGYVANSGVATDERGNRYIVYGKNAYRGIGLVSGNNFDPRLTLQPGASGDAQFELMWRPTGREVFGSTFALDLTIDKIAVDNNLYSLGGEFPLHFPGLVNGASARVPSVEFPVQSAMAAAMTSAAASGQPGVMASQTATMQTAAQFAQQATAQPQTLPGAAAATGICAGQPFCVETSDFVATVTSFRTSQQGVYKVVAATVRFQNKTAQPLVLGYVANSGVATDDRGNRYIVYGRNAYRGIGLVSGNNFDSRLTLQPGAPGDAQFELMWRPTGREVFGSSFLLDLTIDKIAVDNNLYSLGGEFPLHFQGLVNGVSAAVPSVGLPVPCGPGAAGQSAAAQQAASNVSNAATAFSAIGSIFGRKKAAQKAAQVANTAAAGCDPTATAAAAAMTAMAASAADPRAKQAAAQAAAAQAALGAMAASAAASTPPSVVTPQSAAMQRPAKSAQTALMKGMQARQTQPPPQQAAQPQAQGITGVQPAGGGSASPAANASVDWDAPAAPTGSFGKIADYKAMPDVLGIRLGMPLQEAYAVLQRAYPKNRIDNYPINMPILAKPPTVALTVRQSGSTAQDEFRLSTTLPPNAQVVSGILRFTTENHAHRDTLLASLHQKYGKETFALDYQQAVTTNAGKIFEIWWLFDENGKPAHMPGSLTAIMQPPCNGHAQYDGNWDWLKYLVEGGENNSAGYTTLSPWCLSSGVALQVKIGASTGTNANPGPIIETITTNMFDIPLAYRSDKATAAWWRATLEKLKQQEIERSKQKKPKL